MTKIVETVLELVLKKRPRHTRFISRALEMLETEEANEAANYINFLQGEGKTIEFIADSYILIIDDAFNEAIYFSKYKKYRNSKFSDVYDSVYNNPDFMEKYMIGLGLSSYWWSSHVQIRRFFREIINKSALMEKYLEVGPGHGIYLRDAIRSTKFSKIRAIDISQTSIDLTSRLLKHHGSGDSDTCQLKVGDFFSEDLDPENDFLVMGEVLEHVENPELFLKQAYNSIKSDGCLFMTTCLNAPAIDHIYNPDSIKDLEELILNQRFVIKDSLKIGTSIYSIEECEKNKFSINVAYLLSKS
jgi:2-polyprenyl-3-methyl-5-hydroxy-6-metoxy-1,4-benzoquinol methylase